jgi:hypothetical protein
MAVSTTTAAELTAEQVQKILVQPLEQASVFLAAGPRIFDANGSPVRIPEMDGPTSPDWIGENELITEKDVTFDEVTLLPSTLKSVKTITRFRTNSRGKASSLWTRHCGTGWSAMWPPSSTRSCCLRPGTASPRRRACSPTAGRSPLS